jgi:HK97 family phage major capsid protein/HK97 family phage prohead protease
MTTATKTLKPGTKEERVFQVQRAAVNEDARTIELSFSSEEPYDRWWGREILAHEKKSVRLGRLKRGGPLLCDHDARDHVGVIESVRIDDDLVGRAVVRFGKSARAEEVWQDVKDGIRQNVSVGYVIHKAQLVETGDESTETFRVTDWEPYEVSLVSVPADATVGVGRAHETTPVIEAAPPIATPSQEKTIMSDQTTHAAADLAAAETRAADAARQGESRRINDIFAIGEDHEDIGGLTLARAAIKDGTSVAEFQAKLLAAKREKTAAAGIQYGAGARTKDNLADDAKRGFASYGEFCADVVRAASDKGVSERLVRAATTYGNEASGPDGGYAVPPQFASEIASIAYAQDSLLSLCDNTPVAGNTMTFPKDETTPWGSTGITAAWEGEASQTTPKKPALGESQLKLRKLKVLVAASEELLADASAMSTYITRKCGEAVEWKVNDAVINGTGAGMPLGVMVAASTVSQAKETSQTAATINAANVSKMYGRVIKGPGANLAWIVHPDAINQIMQLTIGDQSIWTPPSEGFKSAPNGFLLGRPILESDACQTLGTVGDIILGNFNGYRAITKAGGAEFAQSMHLWFDQDLMAFRLIFRMDGQPALAAAVSPKNGSSTRSHFATLATRA